MAEWIVRTISASSIKDKTEIHDGGDSSTKQGAVEGVGRVAGTAAR